VLVEEAGEAGHAEAVKAGVFDHVEHVGERRGGLVIPEADADCPFEIRPDGGERCAGAGSRGGLVLCSGLLGIRVVALVVLLLCGMGRGLEARCRLKPAPQFITWTPAGWYSNSNRRSSP